jgi:hypothetical protein
LLGQGFGFGVGFVRFAFAGTAAEFGIGGLLWRDGHPPLTARRIPSVFRGGYAAAGPPAPAPAPAAAGTGTGAAAAGGTPRPACHGTGTPRAAAVAVVAAVGAIAIPAGG